MSEYNKTVLTNAGLDLMARANKGAAKFTITRAATSTEQLSEKSMADLQQLTELPSLMQYGVINNVANSSQDSNIVIGVELVFNNQDLANGYNINTIGLFAKENGKDKEILYAITTAVTPESMPDFKNKVLFKFNVTMFVAVSQADSVTVNVTDNGVVTQEQLSTIIKQTVDSIENDIQLNIKKVNTLGNPIQVSSDTNPDTLCDPGIYYSENGFNFGSKAPADYWQGKSYLIVFHGDRPDRSYNYFQQFLFQSTKDTYNIWCRGGYQYYSDSYYTFEFQNLKNIYGKLKQISINGGDPIDPDDNGRINLDIPKTNLSGLETKADAKSAHDTLAASITSTRNSLSGDIKATHDSLSTDIKTARDALSADIAKRVLTVNEKSPNSSGNVVLTDFDHPTQVFNDTDVNLDTLTATGLYELRNATIQNSLSSLPGFTQLNATYAYLIAINNPSLDNTFQILICRQMQNFVLDYRYINKSYNDYPVFKRIIDSSDYSNLFSMIDQVDKKELVHFCDDLDSGVAYSKANPNVFVATP
ncbi:MULTISPECIES: hypothetical protein [unclassified Lactobacillus]|uniref:hypothetical protein n=1 Tax=unclassified Lactobacillus TaxID=2620435 RepID=UPI00226ABE8E|nr:MULTISPECIES: hypothetical protein [unclassified Lactobacillus]MCX8721314.1 hypothetical protein [Lactobacillus sp. B4010]MCX8732952.1 hypothetical protein [Lactobacillus sp. B4015]MCX8735605.1 hypothetical protein [Lactobacillus sp. B4012]